MVTTERRLGQKTLDFLIDLSLDTRDEPWFRELVNDYIFVDFFHDYLLRKGRYRNEFTRGDYFKKG